MCSEKLSQGGVREVEGLGRLPARAYELKEREGRVSTRSGQWERAEIGQKQPLDAYAKSGAIQHADSHALDRIGKGCRVITFFDQHSL